MKVVIWWHCKRYNAWWNPSCWESGDKGPGIFMSGGYILA